MISVVIPVIDEEDSIGDTLNAVSNVLESSSYTPYEMIVVDDGSQDRTGEIARALGAKVLVHPTNAGYGRSLKHGIAAASFDTIVIMDGDATYSAEVIPRLLEEFKKGFDLVVGLRHGQHYRGSWWRYPMRLLLRAIVEFTVGKRIPDPNSGQRVFSKTTIMPYFAHLSDKFSFTTSMTMVYMLTGRFVSYVPVPYNLRRGRTKVHLFMDSLRTLQFVVHSIISYNPIKLFLVLSGLSLLVGALSLVLFPVIGLRTAVGFAVLSVFIALVLFGMGLLADLLKPTMRHIHITHEDGDWLDKMSDDT